VVAELATPNRGNNAIGNSEVTAIGRHKDTQKHAIRSTMPAVAEVDGDKPKLSKSNVKTTNKIMPKIKPIAFPLPKPFLDSVLSVLKDNILYFLQQLSIYVNRFDLHKK